MLFIKTNLNDQVEVRIDLYEDEIFTICPSCGKEHQVDIETVRQIDCWSSTSISCGKDECNKRMREKATAATVTNSNQIIRCLSGQHEVGDITLAPESTIRLD